MTAYREMPKYQCHKQVRALKIKAIARKPNPDPTGRSAASSYGATITPSEDGYGAFDVPPEYMNKHQPEVGGYYVVYEDGYKSYSPAAAFESGYSPRADAHVALPVVDHGPDSLERAMESKTYQDGTTAFGPAPLPDVSPAPVSWRPDTQAQRDAWLELEGPKWVRRLLDEYIAAKKGRAAAED